MVSMAKNYVVGGSGDHVAVENAGAFTGMLVADEATALFTQT